MMGPGPFRGRPFGPYGRGPSIYGFQNCLEFNTRYSGISVKPIIKQQEKNTHHRNSLSFLNPSFLYYHYNRKTWDWIDQL